MNSKTKTPEFPKIVTNGYRYRILFRPLEKSEWVYLSDISTGPEGPAGTFRYTVEFRWLWRARRRAAAIFKSQVRMFREYDIWMELE